MVYDKLKDMEPDELVSFIDSVKYNKILYCFDYDKAIKIIKSEKILNAEYGLNGDWTDTHNTCLKNGYAVMNNDVYLNSTWAIPTLLNTDTDEEYPCYIEIDKSDETYETRNGWNSEEEKQLNDGTYQEKLI